MKTKDVIDHFGGVRQAAEALCISPAAVYQWGEDVPRARQAHVELATKGKIKRKRPGEE